MHRYLAEFDFRYNHRKITDKERASKAMEGIEGSASLIDGLTKPTSVKQKAKSFLRWRKSQNY